MKLPKTTTEETHTRAEAIEAALHSAVSVPLKLAMKVDSLWETMMKLAVVGNITCKSDLQVSMLMNFPLYPSVRLTMPRFAQNLELVNWLLNTSSRIYGLN